MDSSDASRATAAAAATAAKDGAAGPAPRPDRLTLPREQLALAFPFHFVLDRQMVLVEVGNALRKVAPELVVGEPIARLITMSLPSNVACDLAGWRSCSGRVVALHTDGNRQTFLGHFLDDLESGGLLFLGTQSMIGDSALARHAQTLRELSAHGPLVALIDGERAQRAAAQQLGTLTSELRLQHDKLVQGQRRDQLRARVGDVLARSSSVSAAAPVILEALCENLAVQAALLWTPDPLTMDMVCVATHGVNETVAPFLAESRGRRFPYGHGLIGRVQRLRTTVWLPDLAADDLYVRADSALRCGLRGAVAFPARAEGGLHAVLELLTDRILPRDSELAAVAEEQMQKLADFVERRRALEERHSLASLVDCARVFIATVTLDGEALYVNAAGREMLGIPLDAPLSQSLDDIHTPETRRVIREIAFPIILSAGNWTGVGQLRGRDGCPPLDVSIHMFLLRDSIAGAPQQLAIVQQDISAECRTVETLRDSERHYRTIVDEVREVIFRADALSRWTLLNQAWEELTGVSAAESLGRHASELIHPEDVAHNRAMFEALRRRGVDETRHVIRFARPDGVIREVEVYARAVFDDDDQLSGFSGTINDITEQRKTIEALTRARDTAEQATQAKSQFLANMSHEIRTPMNGVLGMIEVLARTSLDPGQREALEAARSSAEILLALVQDLLDFSKIEAGKMQTQRVPVELRPLFDRLLAPLVSTAKTRGLTLTWHVDEGVPATVLIDPQYLRQILANLVGNALKFTEVGGVRVQARCQSAGDEDELVVSIIDTGIGIPADKQRFIFDAFAQADGTITRRFGGTGLGLAICKQLAQLMNGTLAVDSEAGVGSTFTFSGRVGRMASLPPQPAPTPPRPLSGRHFDVLVAEDNAINQLVAIRLLTQAGHRVTAVATGLEALERLAQQRFDILLMDVQMPGLDGLQTTRLLREREEGSATRLPILALTAQALREDRDRCLEAGMDGYVAKPLQVDVLLAAIDDLVPTSTAPWDRAALAKLVNHDEALLDEVLQLFQTEAPIMLATVRKAIGSGEAKAIAQSAHCLKGALLNFAAAPAAAVALQIELAGRSNDVAAAATALVTLEHELMRLLDTLGAHAA